MGFFSINKEVFSIGISLYRPIRGTKSDGKLNLLIIVRYSVLVLAFYAITNIIFKELFTPNWKGDLDFLN